MSDTTSRKADLPRERYATGERIFMEGAAADCAYIIESGEVAITKSAGGKETVLAKLGPGVIIGEMALIDDSARMASAAAIGTTTVLRVTRDQFRQKLDVADPFIRRLLMLLAENVRTITAKHMASVQA